MSEEIDGEFMAGPVERHMYSWLPYGTSCVSGKSDSNVRTVPDSPTRSTRLAITAPQFFPRVTVRKTLQFRLSSGVRLHRCPAFLHAIADTRLREDVHRIARIVSQLLAKSLHDCSDQSRFT